MRGWRGRRVVITAGPTREALDPVRFLSNESSGRMGWALARAARRAGASVTLIAGLTERPVPKGVRLLSVTSAREMCAATCRAARKAHAVIGAAAVADWRPLQRSRLKLKKHGGRLILTLTPNPDILATVARQRKGPYPRLAGFALETHRLLGNAKKKLVQKNLDLIVANRPTALGQSRTQAWILTPDGATAHVRGTKDLLARRILSTLLKMVNRIPFAKSRGGNGTSRGRKAFSLTLPSPKWRGRITLNRQRDKVNQHDRPA